MKLCCDVFYLFFNNFPGCLKLKTILLRLGLMVILMFSFQSLAGISILKNSDSKDIIEFSFFIDKYSLNEMVIDRNTYTTVECEATAYTSKKGLPSLPFFNANFIIPGDAHMECEVLDSTIEEIHIKKIIPSKGYISRKVNPETVPFTFDSFYTTNSWYPSQKVIVSSPYIIHTVRGITLNIYPFQYNPKSGILRVTKSMKVRLKKSGTDYKNSTPVSAPVLPPAFEGMCKRQFENYSQPLSVPSQFPDGDKMIIVAATALAGALQPLVEWKNQKGIKTELFIYPDQTGGEGVDKLKQFLQSKFNAEAFSYLLFVGDLNDIPTYIEGKFVDEQSLEDLLYARLNGEDIFPDVLMGRFSSSKAEDISAIAKKTIHYEKYPGNNGDWYQKATGIASDEAAIRYKDSYYMENHRRKLLEYGYTTVDQIYDPNASNDYLISVMNEGRGWINYMGHGITESWITTKFNNDDVAKLLPSNKPSIIMSASCLVGNFSRHCLAEALTIVPDKGAVVFTGPTYSVDWVKPQIVFKEMLEYLIVNDICLSVGAIFYNGGLKMLRSDINNKETHSIFNSWILFGDPSLMPFTKKPIPLSVSYPLSISKSDQNIVINCKDSITGRICLSNSKKGILGTKLLTAKSNAVSFPLTISDDIDSIILTVTAFNRIPLTKIIPVTEAQSITVISPELSSRFYTGQQMQIEWMCSDTTVKAVNLEFSSDNGTTFSNIVSNVDNNGAYLWMIPDVSESEYCRIKISGVNTTLSSVSPLFSIRPTPSIILSQSIFDLQLPPDTTVTLSFEIINTGKSDLNYSLMNKIETGFEENNCMINEVVTGDSSYKYVEIINDGKAVNLTGWKLKWKNNNSELDSAQFPDNYILEHNGIVTCTNDSSLINGTSIVFAKNFDLSNSNPFRIGLYSKYYIRDIIITEKFDLNADHEVFGKWKSGKTPTYKDPVLYRDGTDSCSSGKNWKTGFSGSFNKINPDQRLQICWLTMPSGPDIISRQHKKSVSMKIVTDRLPDSTYFDTIIVCHDAPDTSARLFIPVRLIVGTSSKVKKTIAVNHSGIVSIVNTGRMLHFTFSANRSMRKEVRIYNISGQLLHFESGTLLRSWNFKDERRVIPNGQYFAVVKIYDKETEVYKSTFPVCLIKR